MKFKDFLNEETLHKGGISHIEHPSDMAFNGQKGAHHAYNTLKKVSHGKAKITRKIDDRMSFHAIRHKDGRVGVKYKGKSAHYSYSHKEIDSQHKDKPYLAKPLKHLHSHLHKVLPKRPGEYQGGYMSHHSERHHDGDHIHHTPNTLTYHAPLKSKQGQKLHKSKVSVAVHTELKGPHKIPHPIHGHDEFHHHADVHLVPHTVEGSHNHPHPEHKAKADEHLKHAGKLMKGKKYHHLAGHETTLRTYINKTIRDGSKPSVKGYHSHLKDHHNRGIEKVKMEKTKERKKAERDAHLSHVEKNSHHFSKTLKLHHHLQQATNHLARGLERHGHGGFHTKIGKEKSGGEGYVAHGLKVVDRQAFSKANLARSDSFKKK